MKVDRFFHIRQRDSMKGGATVRVQGETGGEKVKVQVAFCSIKDAFCRKTGRDTAASKEEVYEIPVDALPLKLHRIASEVVKRDRKIPRRFRQDTELVQRDFGYATKYFSADPRDTIDTSIVTAHD